MPRDLAVAIERLSGGPPTCQLLVPEESTIIMLLSPASSTSFWKIASAVGERQILPKQTNTTLIIIIFPWQTTWGKYH
jgi:hypothetical protein